MAEIFNEPQEPLKKVDKETGDINYIYPLTTDKQVMMSDGSRLNTLLNESILYLGDTKDDLIAETINADTLGGNPPSYYATAAEVQTARATAENAMPKTGGAFEGNVGANNGDVWFVGNSSFAAFDVFFTDTDSVRKARRMFVDANGNAGIQLFKSDDYTILDHNPIMTFRGGTMTGALTLSADPTANMHAATKQYVDNKTGMDLLWTNASPNSAFVPQTVNVDLSKYRFTMIIFRLSKDDGSNFQFDYISRVDGHKCLSSLSWGGSDFTREFYVHTTGVQFGSSTNNNTNNIPMYIYGVK